MGGGGGGGAFSNRTPGELREQVRKAEEKVAATAFEGELSNTLSELLGNFNSRDAEKVSNRIEDVKNALAGDIEGTFNTLFGGSVAKHTYVDGLSDIDSIITLNGTELEGASPQVALSKMQRIISERLKGVVSVTHGKMAVTVEYPDGMVIQLLPAVRAKDRGLLVPSSRRDSWSKIAPMAFQEALTKRNEQCGHKLVPTIKLAKAINGQLPEAQRLSGYHMESLAIAAFRNYSGPMTTSAMLPTFFERASELVKAPIRDRTGQSIHVDEYLGPAKGEQRLVASHLLSRIARRMRNASAASSTAQWRSLFGLEP
jgi:hypothetical protein